MKRVQAVFNVVAADVVFHKIYEKSLILTRTGSSNGHLWVQKIDTPLKRMLNMRWKLFTILWKTGIGANFL